MVGVDSLASCSNKNLYVQKSILLSNVGWSWVLNVCSHFSLSKLEVGVKDSVLVGDPHCHGRQAHQSRNGRMKGVQDDQVCSWQSHKLSLIFSELGAVRKSSFPHGCQNILVALELLDFKCEGFSPRLVLPGWNTVLSIPELWFSVWDCMPGQKAIFKHIACNQASGS